jgi:hypothetical protein
MPHRYAFSPKGVLRHIKPELRCQYFVANRLFTGESFLSRDKPDLDALCAAIQALPPAERTDVDQDLQDVYSLADADGMRLIYEEARFRGEDLTAVLIEMDGPYDTAMWTLLNRANLFAELLRFHSADRLNRRHWHVRLGVSDGTVDVSERATERLSGALSTYLLQREGRGQHCQVEVLQRSSGYLFIAYPEDYPDVLFEYDEDNKLDRRKIRPTTDLLFFYSPDRQRLEIYSQGGRQKIQDLQAIFAQTILGIGLGPDQAQGKIYQVNRLKEANFSFVIDPASGLEGIEVKWVYLHPVTGGKGVTLHVDGPAGRGVSHAAEQYFDVHLGQVTDKYPFHLMDVRKAFLQARFRPLGTKRRGRSRSFPLTPNGCWLDQEGIDGVIRKVLIDSGIEQPARDLVAV